MAKQKSDRDVIQVYHTVTGKEREMGTVQFESYGKKNGWAEIPSNGKKPALGAAGNSSTKGTKTKADGGDEGGEGDPKLSKVGNATDAIEAIKAMKTVEEIKAFIAGESRTSIIAAADKVIAQIENDEQ